VVVARLLLGPLLRHVGRHDATIWVEVDERCTVEVAAGGHTARTPTFTVAGHHYALVLLDGLEAGSSTEYDVRLDGDVVWPSAGAPYPPSLIRTVDEERPFRLLFGSCRYATPTSVNDTRFAADALDTYAVRLVHKPPEQWPDALLLLGDQVYADETSSITQEYIRSRRDVTKPPYTDVADFEEYTRLYYESWSDPNVRWLLSTVPSSMIFDDHDVKDDWNTSHAWRAEMQQTDWWEERITGALMSYWVYQHLGNLSPAALATDEMYRRVQEVDDAEPMLRDFAQAADREADGAKGAQWSYCRDFGRSRLIVIDSRCGRILAEDHRSMLSEAEFGWLEQQVAGEYDHLLVGTSLPWLMPRALHDVESWNEALCAGSRGPLAARVGEKIRRAADLEHWAAFRRSFDRLSDLLARVGRGEHGGTPPATICVLSGDVHHAYVAEASFGDAVKSRVYQLTCSPVHNFVPPFMKVAFRLSWSGVAERSTRLALRLLSTVPALKLHWHRIAGPYFGNEIATLTLDGRSARLLLERADSSARPALTPVAAVPLASVQDERGEAPADQAAATARRHGH
jgi:hypothetical protein